MLTRCSSTVRSEVIESPFCHGEDAEEEEEAEVPIPMERKVDFPEVKESTWCFFFFFGLLGEEVLLPIGAFVGIFQPSLSAFHPPKLRSPICILST